MKTVLFSLLLCITGFAHADCQSYTTKTLPFTFNVNTKIPLTDLRKVGHGRELGLVSATTEIHEKECVVYVGYDDVTLYIAAEVGEDRCAKRHVMKHELTHIDIYKTALSAFDNKNSGMGTLEEKMNEARELLINIRAVHNEFDSPDELDTNRTACRGIMTRMTG